ncbi:hypothetical protein JCM3765_007558, partial [Sporobolomyces pararoseus]
MTTTTTGTPSNNNTSKPHLSSLSLGPTPRPPPSLASPSPSTTTTTSHHSRRITSWGSINSDSGFSTLGDRGMTPLPSPMENREWGFLPSSSSGDKSWQNGGGGMIQSWGKKSQRWDSGEFNGEASNKSWMSNFQPIPPPPSSSSPTRQTTLPTVPSPTPSSTTSSTTTKEQPLPVPSRSKTLSFFDSSSSPVIAPSSSSTSLQSGGGSDPSFLLLSPPPNPPSRNNSLSERSSSSSYYRPNRPRSSSRLSISDLPDQSSTSSDPLRSSTISNTSSTSWLEDFNPLITNLDSKGGGGGNKRNRVSSVGSWSCEVNHIRSRTDTNQSSDSSIETGEFGRERRRLFMDLQEEKDNSTIGEGGGGLETVKNSPDRPILKQLDTSTPSSRERSISGGLITKPLSSLPTAVDTPNRGGGSYRDSPPPLIDLSQLQSNRQNSLLLAPNNTDKGTVTPRTPPSMEELQKIIGETKISSSSFTSSDTIEKGDLVGDYKVIRLLGKGAFSRVALASKGEKEGEVALKLMERKSCETNERMRISVLREVEVLKTISHPNLATLKHSFLTRLYTVLVLDFCPGGELFDFLQEYYSELTEGLARRMVSELCDAVGWMHSVGLVHRDIKLENILLTRKVFPLGNNELEEEEAILKLTDFGLSRFINPRSPLLQTRCGSEAYAAPELLMGKLYDGTLTDSWAVGIVFYAVVTGGLPFVEQVETFKEKFEGLERRVSTRGGRKGYLLKIAKAEYSWPEDKEEGKIRFSKELKQIVGKLLVRDPNKRLRVGSPSFWDCEWIKNGPGRIERKL